MFVDVKCPVCGNRVGNGGDGLLFRCSCGWSGRMSPEDEKVLEDLFRRHKERNDET